MSGGSETVRTDIPSWVRPYAESYMQQAQQTSRLPYTPYGGQTVAQLNPYQTSALDATAKRAIGGSPVNDAAAGEIRNTLGGQYLGQGQATNPYAGANPYLTGMIDQSSSDVVRNYRDAITPQLDMLAARSGSFGNSGVDQARTDSQRVLANQLGDISTGLRYQDYGLQAQLGENAANRSFTGFQNERGRMQGAVGMAPTIANQDYLDAEQLGRAGGAYQAQEQANLGDAYSRFQEAQNYPYKQLETAGRGMGFNFGSSQTGPGANPLAQGAGTALSLYSLSKMPTGGK